jgi:signal transduction histidine kinase
MNTRVARLFGTARPFLPAALFAAALMALSPFVRHHNYLLFHSLTEIGAATISFATFLFTWNTRRYQNSFLRIVGISALFVGFFEALHFLAFPGMAVFPGYDSNLSPQLWLCARTFQAGSVVVGLALLNRRVGTTRLLVCLTAAFALTCAAVFLGYAPMAVRPGGMGLTSFKVVMESVLAATMIGAVALLRRVKAQFSPRVFRYLVANASVMAVTEISFTLYTRPYDEMNFLGHVLLICGVYWGYKAILETGLTDPNEAQFRDLVLAREESDRVKGRLREMNDHLVAADVRKNEFLAMLSHELRNPLAALRTASYILETGSSAPDQAHRTLAVIDRQVGHLTRLVDDLLDVTRVSRGKVQLRRETLDLADLVRRVGEDHRPIFVERGIDFAVRVPDAPVPVNGDGTRLAQIVGNLLHNAAKFTAAGGRVALLLERDLGRHAVICVRDTGAGIAPDTLAHVFEPFVQADRTLDRSGGGLGLGLALVKGLAELHGGGVDVQSMGPGQGSEFSVRLPLAPAPAPCTDTTPDAVAIASPRRVLLIEDNTDTAQSLGEALALRGHVVRVASTGTAGVREAERFGPDVVLCDIGLPGVDGYQVARTLRAHPTLRCALLVALSGFASHEDVDKAKQAGFDHHMAKPPDLDALDRLFASSQFPR